MVINHTVLDTKKSETFTRLTWCQSRWLE